MAHNIKITPIPHKNKDGSESKTKKDYRVTDKTRRKVIEVGVASSQKAAEALVSEHRSRVFAAHHAIHPGDRAFNKKHAERKSDV